VSRHEQDAIEPPWPPFAVTTGATHEREPATHEVIMSKNAIKGIPALLGDARRALAGADPRRGIMSAST